MSSYGAAVAGQKMLHRTAPLKDFALKPLHMEDGDNFEPMDADGAVVSPLKKETIAGDFISANASSDKNLPKSVNAVEKSVNKAHAPVFILVSGHLERGVDARQMWGANGFIQSIVDTAIGTATSTLTTMVQSASVKEGTALDSATMNTIDATTITLSSTDTPGTAHIVTTTTTTALLVNPSADPLTTTTTSVETTLTTSPDSAVDTTTDTTTEAEPVAVEESLSDWQAITPHYTGWWRGHISHGEEYLLQVLFVFVSLRCTTYQTHLSLRCI